MSEKLAATKQDISHVEDADIAKKSSKESLDLQDEVNDIEIIPLLDRRMLPMLWVCAIVYCCSTMNGYDGSLMSSIYTNENYIEYFKTDVNSSTSTGLVVAIYNVGTICGAFFASLMDWKGRKTAILVGSFGTVVGAIVTAVAPNINTLIGGRFLMSFFTTIACAAAPTYCVELAPSHHKGVVAGCYNTLWYVGSITAAFSAYGSALHQEGNAQFKIPLWLQMLFPGLVCVFGILIPESPRWLVGVGRVDDARKVLTRFHCGGDSTHPSIDYEIAQMLGSFDGVSLDDPVKVLDLRPMIKDRSNIWRTFLITAFAWYGQFSGNNVCSYYLPTMLNNVGMTTETTNVLMNALYSIVSWIASLLGSLVHDRFGRRKMFMGAALGAALALTGLAICTARFQANGADAAAKGTLVFIFLFGVIFSFSFTPMQPIYPSEVASNVLRSRSMIVLNLVSGIAQFVNQFASPKAMANIGYWFYVFYAIWDVHEFVIFYFFFVETKNKSLEDLDKIFAAKNPRKVSVGNYEDEDESQFELERERDNVVKSYKHQMERDREEAA